MADPTAGARSRPNVRQIAVLAGVSKSTVSNVLRNPEVVAEQTRQRVEAVMKQLGYVPNGAARQLGGGTSQIAGCMLPDVANPYFADVARGAEDSLAEAGMMMLLCSTDVEIGKQKHYLRMLEEHGARGIVVSPVGPDIDPLLQIQQRGTPVVLMGRSSPDNQLCSVDVDDQAGGRLAAEHVLGLGHRHMVYLVGERLWHDRRRQGVRDTVAAAGPACRLTEIEIPPRADVAQIDTAVQHIISLDPRPTALLCFNDHTAVAVLNGLQRRQLRVPADISLVGYDDLPFAAVLSPPLTTVRQPRYELGRAAAELLLNEWQADHCHQQRWFEPILITRGSTGPPKKT